MGILAIAVGIVILDQVSKEFILRTFSLGETLPVFPGFFQWCHVRNTGAAWGIFSGFNHGLIFLSLIMLGLIWRYRHDVMAGGRAYGAAMGLLTAGIIGNLIDRVKFGYVVDFIDFYWRSYHFPAFNVADASICTGVGLYILIQWRHPREADPAAASGVPL